MLENCLFIKILLFFVFLRQHRHCLQHAMHHIDMPYFISMQNLNRKYSFVRRQNSEWWFYFSSLKMLECHSWHFNVVTFPRSMANWIFFVLPLSARNCINEMTHGCIGKWIITRHKRTEWVCDWLTVDLSERYPQKLVCRFDTHTHEKHSSIRFE